MQFKFLRIFSLSNMKILLYFIFFLISVSAKDDDTLVFVHIVYRHGDRTPVSSYPTDPYQNESLWPVPFGELTDEGKEREYKLGLWLRERYSGFLPEKYSVNDIYVRSTDVDRTLASAEANLAGLYSQDISSTIWEYDNCPQLPIIPIHIVPFAQDAILNAESTCPYYDELYAELLESQSFLEIQEELLSVYSNLTYYSGMSIETLYDLALIYDTLNVESLFNLPLPDWTQNVFPNPMKKWVNFFYSTFSYTPALQRLKTGVFFNEIKNRLNAKISGTLQPDRIMWIYSAHDENIANILMTMGAFDPPAIPPYASAILFELKQSANNGYYYLETFYKNDTNAHQITILNCSEQCLLSEVFELLAPFLLTEDEWNIECKNTQR